jgi:hypothetical protein
LEAEGVEREEIGDRSIGNAVDGIADGTPDDEADRGGR